MFKKRVKKEAVEVPFQVEEAQAEEQDKREKDNQGSSVLLQSRAIKKQKTKQEQSNEKKGNAGASITKHAKQGLEDITGLIDKKYLKEQYEEETEENGNQKKYSLKTEMMKKFEQDHNLILDQEEEDEYQIITDIEQDKAKEVENLINNQKMVAQNQERFQFQISTKPIINTAGPGFSEVRFSYDQKAKSLAQIEDARMKKLFGCDLFSTDFEKTNQQKMSKEAQKEKAEREFRQFQDKFLKRGRTYKLNQMKANEYNTYLDKLN